MIVFEIIATGLGIAALVMLLAVIVKPEVF